ncbi:MFS general substrate transporter [Apiospora kogelbergensis]|uniref:MFS general substrate transporter n=2 Tax=Apiospora kogelbergensis TaxID=1337665 RepID=A0AAW0R5U2_9PEZI
MDPLISVLSSLLVELAGVAFGAFTGEPTVPGPVVQAVVIDFSNQASNIAQRDVIYTIDPKVSSRMNTAYMVAGVSGQFAGTAVRNKLYALGGSAVACSTVSYVNG